MTKKICALILFFFFLSNSVGASDFATHIQQTYTLTTRGANVTETITITNLSDLSYPTSFSYLLYSDQIQDLAITTLQKQPIDFDQIPFAGTTKVTMRFHQPTVGKGKSQTYQLDYFSPEIRPDAQSALYFIPQSPNPNTDITTTVIVPHTICSNPTVIPATITLDRQDSFTRIEYNQSENKRAVTIVCQPQRYASLTLTYQLANPTITPIETQIALPPDTSYQRIMFNSIVPAPLRLVTDVDGNRIATYRLEPKQTISVAVVATAEITNANELFTLDTADSKIHTADQPHWPASNHQIKQLAKSLSTAEAIYQYIVTHARYNPDQFNTSTSRHSGQIIIANPNNLTAEDFTDVFITLCRAAGIPSRRVIGFIPPYNQKLYPQEFPDQNLHVYPEWYDSATQTWIQVDPFWQTTNPFQHFWPVTDQSRIVLVINGANDSKPYPASSIQVTAASKITFPPPTITATIHNSLISKLFPRRMSVTITNNSPYALYNQPLTIVADHNPIQSLTLNRLDINGSSIIPLTINTHQTLHVQTSYGTIPIQSSSTALASTATITAVLVAIASLSAVISGRLLVSRRRR